MQIYDSINKELSVLQSASRSIRKYYIKCVWGAGARVNELINRQACEGSWEGTAPAWVVGFHVHVPPARWYLFGKNKFTVTTEATWLGDIKFHLQSSSFGSIAHLPDSYFNKAWGENPYWKWPATRKLKTNTVILQLCQRNARKPPALTIQKRLMKHYL